jgi:hypothetical protein
MSSARIEVFIHKEFYYATVENGITLRLVSGFEDEKIGYYGLIKLTGVNLPITDPRRGDATVLDNILAPTPANYAKLSAMFKQEVSLYL